MNMHNNYIALVNPDKIKVDMSYQREAEASRVDKIVKNFSMDVFNPPKVSHRADGFYYIFDGQHSMLAHKKVFGDNAPINCRVFEGLSHDEEAELFIQQNGISKEVKTNDKLKAEFSKENSDVKEMVDAARIAGIRIDFNKGLCPNHISATAASYAIWQLLGKDQFINVLTVLKKAFGGDGNAFTNGFLKGMAFIYKHYGDKIKNQAMIDALSRNTPNFYASRARDMHGSVMIKYARAFVDAYNYKKVNRLEDPREVK